MQLIRKMKIVRADMVVDSCLRLFFFRSSTKAAKHHQQKRSHWSPGGGRWVGSSARNFSRDMWVWVNTYRYIFSGMNIHLPAILGFTRYQGFDPSPCLVTCLVLMRTNFPRLDELIGPGGEKRRSCLAWDTCAHRPLCRRTGECQGGESKMLVLRCRYGRFG